MSVKSISINATTYSSSTSGGATETLLLSINTNGIQTAAIGSTKTTGNTLTITVYDSGLSSGSEAVTYTVGSGDTLTTIASGVVSAINADTNLQAIGVSANSASTVVNIKSKSLNNTTYTQSVSGGATETIALGLSTGITQYAYNNLNELTGVSAGGLARFQGSTNKAVKSTTINSTVPATLNWSENFTGNASLSAGLNNATVSAVDGANNTVTNPYKLSVNSGTSSSLTYDANGNMTSDGTNTYKWDAENRLVEEDYPGSGNYTQYTYDALGQWAKIIETQSGALTSTKQFVWNGGVKPLEARDASSNVISQYFPLGQIISSSKYYYGFDHLGSIQAMTDISGNVVAAYQYGPFGGVSKIQGTLDSDFQYAGNYHHTPSGHCLTTNRPYSSVLGRWLNRDPIAEEGGMNLYAYVENNPINYYDPLGLFVEVTYHQCCHTLTARDTDTGVTFSSDDIASGNGIFQDQSWLDWCGGRGPVPRGFYFIQRPVPSPGHPNAWRYPLVMTGDCVSPGRGGFTIEAGRESNGCIVFWSKVPKFTPNYPTNSDFDTLSQMLDATKPLNVNGIQVPGSLRVVP